MISYRYRVYRSVWTVSLFNRSKDTFISSFASLGTALIRLFRHISSVPPEILFSGRYTIFTIIFGCFSFQFFFHYTVVSPLLGLSTFLSHSFISSNTLIWRNLKVSSYFTRQKTALGEGHKEDGIKERFAQLLYCSRKGLLFIT